MNITYQTKNTTAANTTDGQILATLTGGTPPYTIQWSNGNTGVSLLNIAKGCYDISVTDANACTLTKKICIEANSANTLTPNLPATCTLNAYIYTKDVTCNKETNGLIQVFPSNTAATYTYRWSHNPIATAAKVTNLKVGTYVVTITDDKGCISTKTLTINEPAPLSISFENRHTSSAIANDGSIVAKGSGGTKPYYFAWGGGLPYVAASVNVLTNVPIGNYNVIMSDVNGCKTTTSFAIQNGLLAARNAADTRALIVYPNPATDNLEIENTNEKMPVKSIEIFSFDGVSQKKLDNTHATNLFHTTMQVSELPEGWYFVQVRTQNTVIVRKILIQRD
jgi:hypothetical protein